MAEWTTRAGRLAAARAEFERIMTTPGPEPTGAYLEAGVVGYVFGEMWRRGVLTARDRRLITLSCVGAAGATTPIETHVWAALNSGDLTYEEFDEFVLHAATQLGWPLASALNLHGMLAMLKLAEQRGTEVAPTDHEPWAEPVDDAARRARGVAAYEAVHAAAPPPATTPFRAAATLDYLYGEVWTRHRHLTRRDRRVVTICCAGAAGVDEEVTDQVRAALELGDLTLDELRELVVHYAVYLGWPRGRRLDDLVTAAAEPRA